jgi:hypothetical protein
MKLSVRSCAATAYHPFPRSSLQQHGERSSTTTKISFSRAISSPAPRLLRAAEGDAGALFAVWSGLWEGCLSTHDRLLTLDATRTADVVRLRIAPR